MKLRKILLPTLGIVLAGATTAPFGRVEAAAKPQQESVAEAARKARAEEKAAPKPARVYTNDNIGNVPGVVSVVGSEPAPPPSKQATQPAASKTKPAEGKDAQAAAKPPEKGEAYWRKRFADARKTLAEDSLELNVLQREYNLQQQQYYSNPNVAMQQQYNRSDLNKTLDQINKKKADVEKDNQAISNLQDQLRQAGGDPGWGRAQ